MDLNIASYNYSLNMASPEGIINMLTLFNSMIFRYQNHLKLFQRTRFLL
ncbi:hypothetical protein ACFOG5_17160 [Pedobacter fastidiosus]